MSGKQDNADKSQEVVDQDGDDYRESDDDDFRPDAEDDGDDEVVSDEEFEDKEEKAQIKGYDKVQGSNLIKTRAQREQEAKEKKEYERSVQTSSSADIDAVFQSMKGGNSSASSTKDGTTSTAPSMKDGTSTVANTDAVEEPKVESEKKSESQEKEEYITIKRSYKFAGQVTTEEKRVPKYSAEAKAYFAQLDKDKDKNPESAATIEAAPKKSGGPPLRKKKRSILEDEMSSSKPKKMSTLEKSRLDWAGFVDKEGISDELTHHNKGGYLHKQDFLSKVEHRLDQDWKEGQRRSK